MSRHLSLFRSLAATFLAGLMLLSLEGPFLISQAVAAGAAQAAGGTLTAPQSCASSFTDEEDAGPPSFDLSAAKQSPLFAATWSNDAFNAFVTQHNGWYDSDQQLYFFCDATAVQQLYSSVPLSSKGQTYFDALDFPTDKIQISDLDKYALLGEPCRLVLGDGTCDETKVHVDANGNPVLDSAGKQVTQNDSSCKLAPPVAPTTADPKGKDGWKPVHYDNLPYWTNNCWDAPKVDARVLASLVYLVTPTDQGGAGHEHIRVGRIVQDSQSDQELTKANKEDQNTEDQALLQESTSALSAHYVDNADPHHPKLAQAVDITEIDNIRVTTQIVQKHRLGGDTVSYQYNEFPIQVAWQTDNGISIAPLPNLRNMYEGVQQTTSSGFSALLSQLGLSATINLPTLDATTFADVVGIAGGQSLSNLIGGSIPQGKDLASTLNSLGLQKLASDLGLDKQSLAGTADAAQLAENAGRSVVEGNLKLPSDSLRGGDSAAIYPTIAERYLESTVFKISSGSLPTGGTLSQSDLLTRIGKGRIEQRLGLAPQSLQADSLSGFLASGESVRDLFSADHAAYMDDELGLSYEKTPLTDALTSANIISQADFDQATEKLLAGSLPLGKYLILVGARAVDQGIGSYASAASNPDDTSASQQSSSASCPLDGSVDAGSCLTWLSGSSFAADFVRQSGVNLSCLLPKLLESPSTYSHDCSSPLDGRTPLQGTDAYAAWAASLVSANNSFISSLSSTPALSTDQLKALLASLLQRLDYYHQSATVGGGAAVAALSPSLSQKAAQGKTLVNLIAGQWQPALAGVRAQVQAKADQDLDQSGTSLADPAATAVSAVATRSLALLNQDLQAAWAAQAAVGQSGRSAALNLPGTAVDTVTAQGVESDTPLFSQDPVNQILSGDLSALPTIGKILLAQSLGAGLAGQYQLASTLQPDPSPSFKGAAAYGVSEQGLLGNGAVAGDFERIFTKNLSDQVFARIGQATLLDKAWNVSSAQQNAASQVGAPELRQGITTSGGSTDTSFYASRFATLLSQISAIAAGLKSSNPGLAQSLQKEAGASNDGSISSLKALASSIQVLLKQAGGGSDVAKAQGVSNEITSGRSLDFTQPAQKGSGQQQGGGSCWSNTDLRKLLVNGSKDISGFATGVASCQLSQSFDLPAGSIAGWLKSGAHDNYSYDSLALAVGQASVGTASGKTQAQVKAIGEGILQGRAVSQLQQLIPNYTVFASAYGITNDDLLQLLKGNATSALLKIGGANLDKKLSWPVGTVMNMVDPTCTKAGGCSAQDIENTRLQAMSQAGLNAIGQALGFPSTFDITKGGTFSGDYGQAFLSELIGVSANSLKGSFAKVRASNSPQALLTALGVGDGPLEQQLSSLLVKIQASSGNPQLVQQAVDIIDQGIDSGRTYLLDQVGSQSSPYNAGKAASADSVKPVLQASSDNYKKTLQQLSDLTKGTNLQALVVPYLQNALSTSIDQLVSTYSAQVIKQVADFQARMDSVAAAAGLPKGAIENFIDGKTVDFDSVLKSVGAAQITAKLGGIGNIDDPNLYAAITGINGTGCSASQLLVGNGSCSVRDVDLQSIFKDTSPQGQQRRTVLYDDLLGRAAGTKIESAMGLAAGTIRNLVINPRQGGELLLGQGITKLADQLFKGGDTAPLKAAFLAGFYDPVTNSYTAAFDQSRAVGSLQGALEKTLEKTLSAVAIKRTFGIDMTDADLASLLSGDTSTLVGLGTEAMISGINGKIAALSDQRAPLFKVTYGQVMLAFDVGTPRPGESDADYAARRSAAQRDLQASVYDAAAYQIDHDIPVGFARSMIYGNSAAKAATIGNYALTAIGIKDPDLVNFIKDATGNFQSLADYVNGGLKNFSGLDPASVTDLEDWVGKKLTASFGLDKLPPGVMQSFMGWASTGFDPKQFNVDAIESSVLRCNASDVTSCVEGLGTKIQNWGQDKLFSWGDKAFGFKSGTTSELYGGVKSYLKSGDPGALVAALAGTFLSQPLSQLENSLGLVPGTASLLVGIGVELALGIAASPALIAQFVIGNLFGVYKVEVNTKATADGYYPYVSGYGATGSVDGNHYNYPSPTWQTGEFDVQNQTAYRNGLQAAAQAKVLNVLDDLMVMPTSDWAGGHKVTSQSLWVSQIYTARWQDVQSIEYLLGRPLGTGYGPVTQRLDLSSAPDPQGLYAPTGQRFNIFPDPALTEIHVRW